MAVRLTFQVDLLEPTLGQDGRHPGEFVGVTGDWQTVLGDGEDIAVFDVKLAAVSELPAPEGGGR
jgi:hypothetical protein